MTVTTNPDGLRLILDTQLPDSVLQSFCDMADTLVNEELGSSGLSSDRLNQIAQNLAAHFATMRQRQVKSTRAEGNLTISYQGATGKAFESSFYGQTAVTLDSTGTLAKLTENLKKPSLWVAGYPPE